MLKKIGIALGILLIVSVLIRFFTIDTTKKVKINHLIKYIPESSAVIIETENLQNLITKLIDEDNNLWYYLNEIQELENFHTYLQNVDSLLNEDNETARFFSNNPVNISLHYVGKREPEVLFLFTKPENIVNNIVDTLLKRVVNDEDKISKKNYEEQTIYEIETLSGERYFLYQTKKAVLFSRSEILIEETIRKKDKSNNFLEHKIFNKLYTRLSKESIANVYVNNAGFPDVVSSFSSNAISLKSLRNFSSWFGFQLVIDDNALVFNGITQANPNYFEYLNLFLNQKTEKSDLIEFLPENTAAFISFRFSEIKVFNSDYKKMLKQHGQLNSYHKKLITLKEKTKFDFEAFFNQFVKNEILLFYSNESLVQEPVFMIQLNDEKEAREQFTGLIDSLKAFSVNDSALHASTYVLDAKETIDIWRIDITNPLYVLYGNFFRSRSAECYAFFKNTLLISPKVAKLEHFLNSYSKQKLFVNTAAYEEAENVLSNKSNMLIYSNPQISKKLYYYLLNRKYAGKLKLNEKKVNKLNAFCIELSQKKNEIYNLNFALVYNEDKRINVEKNWMIKLDSTLTRKPLLAKNHYDGSKELFFQDNKNRLYLIDRNGKILFKRAIKEKIIGEAVQIDYYKNTKLQILFAAGKKLYLIDRNGEDVAHFPVKLPAKITSGVAVFDYEKTRDYRYFLATANKKVYALSREGELLPSWKYTSEKIVKNTPQHVRIDDKDYIVMPDSELKILNRRGEVRVKLSEKVNLSDKSTVYSIGSENPYLLCNDAGGSIVKVDFTGKVKKGKLQETPENFVFTYTKENDKSRFVVSYENVVKVFDGKLRLRSEYELENNIKYKPEIFSFANNRKMIGLCSGKQILMLNLNDLRIREMFPLEGISPYVVTYPENTASGLMYSLICGNSDGRLVSYEIED